ncbi:hypothetical protein [Pedococcus sp. P5_B7]
MVGEPEQIRVVAARLRAEADRVRWLATRVLGTGDVAWRSPAATLFRVRVAERADGLRRCAIDLETAARLVEVHAEAVTVARAELAQVVAVGAALGARVVGRG